MSAKKELLINSLQSVEIDERINIPTTVLYLKDGVFIGHQAIDRAEDETSLNENFKLNLGQVAKGRLEPPVFDTGDGRQRSANEISKAFLEALMNGAHDWISSRGLVGATRILVAEPLALDGEEGDTEWLANYRARVRGILESKFQEIEFLPEPFAVFQYYRYGMRHPLLSGNSKYVALVVDFGGGTFDVSVVETTQTGDVSASGRNSRPLAASSTAVGGSYINYTIARELIRRNLDKGVDKNRLDRAWRTFREGAADAVGGYSALSTDLRQFVKNVRRVIAQVEKAKIHIVEGIADWTLDATYVPCPACQITVPKNPFAERPETVEARLDATELRQIFVQNIWRNSLRERLVTALKRADSELGGRPVNLVLLSGGSANIRWLSTLIDEELRPILPEAEILEMRSSFQEVVAKGLAIECARRTYNPGAGDFKSVTYNRLCMVLAADGEVPKAWKYKLISPVGTGEEVSDGTLLHSAYMMGALIDKPLRWKFKLPSPPRRFVDYYLMKSSLDHEDMKSRQNVDHRIHTPPKIDFGASLWFELTVRQDGTAIPKFIYKLDKDEDAASSVEGKPFFLDMTTGAAVSQGAAYLGLDFGTSNSAISYVEHNAIRTYNQRAANAGWKELNELVDSLPYPVANPLGKFLGSTVERDQQERFAEAFESLLFFMTALSYLDYGGRKLGKNTNHFKTLKKSSAGPLSGLLRNILQQQVPGSVFLPKLARLTDAECEQWIHESIEAINARKHHRDAPPMDHCRVLGTLGNILSSALKGWKFGYFEQVRKKAFSSARQGVFRSAHGKHAPFVELSGYEGEHDFSDLEAVLVEADAGKIMRLAPFMFWTQRDPRGENSVALLDSFDGKTVGYRTVEGGAHLAVDSRHELSELFNRCKGFWDADPAGENLICVDANFKADTR